MASAGTEQDPLSARTVIIKKAPDLVFYVICPNCGRSQGGRELKLLLCSCGLWLEPDQKE